MKFKTLSISFLLILYAINVMSQSFNSISKAISKYELSIGVKKVKKDYFFDIRKELNSLGKLAFITKSDTLFLLESYVWPDDTYRGIVWNRFDKVKYAYNNKKFRFDVDQVYTDYTIKLVQDWDTISIRREEKINSTMIEPCYICAVRVIKSKKRVLKIDSITFREFFLLDRDR
jgi:hypothetical protein